MNPIKKFLVNQIGKVVRGGGETTVGYPGLSEARMSVCNGCEYKGKVGLKKDALIRVDGCTICKCPLMTKTKTLFHRDYRNRIDWRLDNLVEILDRNNVPFVLTECDLGKWEDVDYEFLGFKKIISLNMGIVDSTADFGKKRANPLALPTNIMRLDNEQCKCTDDPTCEDEATIVSAAGKSIVSYVLDGEEHKTYPVGFDKEKPVSAKADDAEAVCDGLYGLIRKYETKVFVDALMDGDDMKIIHRGACKLESVRVTDGTTETVVNFTRKCTLAKECTLKGNVPPPSSPTLDLVITDPDGNERTATMDDANYSDTANAPALQNEIQNELPMGSTVTVSVGTSGAYEIEVKVEKGYSLSLGGKAFVNCGCRELFKA